MKQYTITNSKDHDVIGQSHTRLYMIRADGTDDMQVTDGYHTMDELYDHRVTLWIALTKAMEAISFIAKHEKMTVGRYEVWRSKRHNDGKLCFETGTQFVLGVGKCAGGMMTYHIPIERWEETNFAETLEVAPEWDGHTSADVLERLKNL